MRYGETESALIIIGKDTVGKRNLMKTIDVSLATKERKKEGKQENKKKKRRKGTELRILSPIWSVFHFCRRTCLPGHDDGKKKLVRESLRERVKGEVGVSVYLTGGRKWTRVSCVGEHGKWSSDLIQYGKRTGVHGWVWKKMKVSTVVVHHCGQRPRWLNPQMVVMKNIGERRVKEAGKLSQWSLVSILDI